MQKRLDPENLGIILLNAFMDEFFPLESRSTPDTFELMHYNGIPGSNENNKVSSVPANLSHSLWWSIYILTDIFHAGALLLRHGHFAGRRSEVGLHLEPDGHLPADQVAKYRNKLARRPYALLELTPSRDPQKIAAEGGPESHGTAWTYCDGGNTDVNRRRRDCTFLFHTKLYLFENI